MVILKTIILQSLLRQTLIIFNLKLFSQDSLCKQLMNIIQRTISAAKQQPTELVTSLRIIDREERYVFFLLNYYHVRSWLPFFNWLFLCGITKIFVILEHVLKIKRKCHPILYRVQSHAHASTHA